MRWKFLTIHWLHVHWLHNVPQSSFILLFSLSKKLLSFKQIISSQYIHNSLLSDWFDINWQLCRTGDCKITSLGIHGSIYCIRPHATILLLWKKVQNILSFFLIYHRMIVSKYVRHKESNLIEISLFFNLKKEIWEKKLQNLLWHNSW